MVVTRLGSEPVAGGYPVENQPKHAWTGQHRHPQVLEWLARRNRLTTQRHSGLDDPRIQEFTARKWADPDKAAHRMPDNFGSVGGGGTRQFAAVR